METGQRVGLTKEPAPFYIRKLGRSGNSRTISVSSILPQHWLAVKITVVKTAEGVRELRVQEIK